MRDENIFKINLKSRHTKAVTEEYTQIETDIWNDAATEVFKGVYRANCHEHIFHHLKNIMAKRFKRNAARIFVSYMVEADDTSNK